MNRKIASRRIYEGRIINLRVDDVRLPDGRETIREIVEHPGAAVIAPIDGRGNIHLVRQYRDAAAEKLLELPAGKLEDGEEPAECARRELREELGLEAAILKKLASFFSSPGFCDELLHLYLAEDLGVLESDTDHDEFIKHETRPLDSLEDWLVEVRDAKSIAGILLAARFREQRA